MCIVPIVKILLRTGGWGGNEFMIIIEHRMCIYVSKVIYKERISSDS